METALGLARALEGSDFGRWAGGEVYPVANIIHLLGLVMLLGGIGLVDLRLMGALRALPLSALSRALTPLALAGLGLQAMSGAVLLAADAVALAGSAAFGWKLAAIALALANAALFRAWFRTLPADGAVPAAARVMAAASLAAWLSVAVLGRMIAYS